MTEDYRDINRKFWDEVTPHHISSEYYATAEFRRGANVLDPIVREGIGEIAGKRLLHLQCHFGLDTLSLARMGADVTGLDFSGKAIAEARKLAEETGIEATFIESDVLSMPDDLGEFDVVFASWGVISWVQDISAWFRAAAQRLGRGGRLHLVDFHPVAAIMDDTVGPDSAFFVRYPYESDKPLIQDEASDYATPARLRANRTVEWQHGVGSLLNGVIQAGLTIERFRELDRIPWRGLPQLLEAGDGYWRLPPDAPAFPLAFELSAKRE